MPAADLSPIDYMWLSFTHILGSISGAVTHTSFAGGRRVYRDGALILMDFVWTIMIGPSDGRRYPGDLSKLASHGY